MKASELIKRLQELVQEHGDHNVPHIDLSTYASPNVDYDERQWRSAHPIRRAPPPGY